MKACPLDQADLLLDDQPFRIPALWEATALRHQLVGKKGVRWVQWETTINRLYHEADPVTQAAYDQAKGRIQEARGT